ncbi:MAG: hypothetical protein C4523_11210 [Myxococcales bacterium]|nr:MAG: hypothetical protein C4523_11210 [Myxococcales bacterium]
MKAKAILACLILWPAAACFILTAACSSTPDRRLGPGDSATSSDDDFLDNPGGDSTGDERDSLPTDDDPADPYADSDDIAADADLAEEPEREPLSEEELSPDADSDEAIEHETDAADQTAERLVIRVPNVLAVGGSSPLQAVYYEEGGGSRDVSAEAIWTSFNPAVATIDAAAPLLRGVGEGEAAIQARYDSLYSPQIFVRVRPRVRVEARGLWVNRWAHDSAAKVEAIIDKAHRSGFNQIYFQVRGTFDAYYDSTLEPWARMGSKPLGVDPGWDPLQTAIEAAHSRGLELHAWINAFTLWQSATPPTESAPRHMYLQHPEWVMQNANHEPMPLTEYIWASPGNAAVRAHNTAVALDIAARYAVDGLHLDRIRYPSPAYSHDPASEAAYAAAQIERPGLDWYDWEREQVVAQVGEIYAALRDHAPNVVLSAAVMGIYTDIWGWGGVTEGYNDWLQDSRAMVEQGVLDALIPMVYWSCREAYGGFTDFCALVDDHATHATDRFLYIGSDLRASGDVRIEQPAGGRVNYESWPQIERQIEYVRQTSAQGWVLYDYGDMETVGYWDELAEGPFAEPAETPFMWWR